MTALERTLSTPGNDEQQEAGPPVAATAASLRSHVQSTATALCHVLTQEALHQGVLDFTPAPNETANASDHTAVPSGDAGRSPIAHTEPFCGDRSNSTSGLFGMQVPSGEKRFPPRRRSQ